MRFGTGKILGALAPIFLLLAALAPAAAADSLGSVRTSVHSVRGPGATTAASMTFLTINGLSGVDNRITAFVAPATGRLTLIAPEGLADPDGASGMNCTLDNPQPGQMTATQISCVAGYVQVIVGDLSGGNDSFTASPDLPVMIGAVLDGERRPLSGGMGADRIVAGLGPDLLDGGASDDVLIGNGGDDLLAGSSGKDNLSGGGNHDVLYGGAGVDRLNGGAARDLCNGGGAMDIGKGCEILQSIP